MAKIIQIMGSNQAPISEERINRIKRIDQLLKKYFSRELLTVNELEELQAWGAISPFHASFLEQIRSPKKIKEELIEMAKLDQEQEAAWLKLETKLKAAKNKDDDLS